MDLGTFIIAVFCLIDDHRSKIEPSERVAPLQSSLTLRSSLSKSSGSSLASTPTRLSSTTSGGITHSGSLPCVRSTAPPLLLRAPTSVISRNSSGRRSWPSSLTSPLSPSATLCPCRRACSPALTAVGVSREMRPSARMPSSGRHSTASECTYGSAGLG